MVSYANRISSTRSLCQPKSKESYLMNSFEHGTNLAHSVSRVSKQGNNRFPYEVFDALNLPFSAKNIKSLFNKSRALNSRRPLLKNPKQIKQYPISLKLGIDDLSFPRCLPSTRDQSKSLIQRMNCVRSVRNIHENHNQITNLLLVSQYCPHPKSAYLMRRKNIKAEVLLRSVKNHLLNLNKAINKENTTSQKLPNSIVNRVRSSTSLKPRKSKPLLNLEKGNIKFEEWCNITFAVNKDNNILY